MQPNVQLKRVRRRQGPRYDRFFYWFYLPLNFLLIYWPIPFVFEFHPEVKEKFLYRWRDNNGPELWFLFHVMLAVLIGFIVFWSARQCYRPSRFIWLPVILGIISLFIYWG